jgi:predicted DCC family thiol-disulfide oxidoreductase YuxK
MVYHIVYDGNCNLCVTLVQLLEQLDRGQQFRYVPMQDLDVLSTYGITTQHCELGMILVNADQPEQRWQGSEAAEQIGQLLPGGQLFVEAYRRIPNLKEMGDQVYAEVRDNRYDWFGRRASTYRSPYPVPSVPTILHPL